MVRQIVPGATSPPPVELEPDDHDEPGISSHGPSDTLISSGPSLVMQIGGTTWASSELIGKFSISKNNNEPKML